MSSAALKQDLKYTGILAAVYALRVFGFMVILPIIALHTDDYSHATSLTLGLVIGSYGLTQAIFQIILGQASDQYGRKKIVYLGLSLLILSSLLAWSTHDFYVLILARALQGAGAIGSTLSAWCADLTREEHRTKCMALIGGSIGLAFTLAIILSPILSHVLGLRGLFLITAILGALALLLVSTLPNVSIQHVNQVSAKELFSLIQRKDLSRLFFGITSLHALYSALFMFIPLMLIHALPIKQGELWQIYLPLLTLCYLIAFPAIAITEKKHQLVQLIQISQVILTSALFAFYMQNTHALIVGLGLLWLSFTMLEAILPSLASQHAPPERKGLVMGLFGTSQYLGIFIGGSTGGLLYHVFGWTGIVLFALLVLVLWSLHTLFFPKRMMYHLTQPLSETTEKALRNTPGVLALLPTRQHHIIHLSIDKKQCDAPRITEILKPFIDPAKQETSHG